MSVWVVIGALALYLGAMVALHRINVRRQRRASGGFPTLRWLDWDMLLEGLLPPGRDGEPLCAPFGWALPGGQPPPECLEKVSLSAQARRDALIALVQWPASIARPQVWQEAGFDETERAWLTVLGKIRSAPEGALVALSKLPPSPRALYLRVYLALSCQTTPWNLEWVALQAQRRIRAGLRQWGDQASFFFVRAQASALLGFNHAVVDDLARSVYFGRQRRFYVEAVLRTPYIGQVRPALVSQCRRTAEQQVAP